MAIQVVPKWFSTIVISTIMLLYCFNLASPLFGQDSQKQETINWTSEYLERLAESFPDWSPEKYDNVDTALRKSCSLLRKVDSVQSAKHSFSKDRWMITMEVQTNERGDKLLNAAAHFTSQIRDQDGAWGSTRIQNGTLQLNWKKPDLICVCLVVESHQDDPIEQVTWIVNLYNTYVKSKTDAEGSGQKTTKTGSDKSSR